MWKNCFTKLDKASMSKALNKGFQSIFILKTLFCIFSGKSLLWQQQFSGSAKIGDQKEDSDLSSLSMSWGLGCIEAAFGWDLGHVRRFWR